MKRFDRHSGLVLPLARKNVDTDQIIPKQFLKGVTRTGLDRQLFFNWRYSDTGEPNPEFELNLPRYKGATILVAGENFGCGSSREHAAWALGEYGIRVVIAASLADIFRQNCYQNGILPVELPADQVGGIMDSAYQVEGYSAVADLERQTLTDSRGNRFEFAIDPFNKHCMLEGLDAIGLTLAHEDAIKDYELRNGIAGESVEVTE